MIFGYSLHLLSSSPPFSLPFDCCQSVPCIHASVSMMCVVLNSKLFGVLLTFCLTEIRILTRTRFENSMGLGFIQQVVDYYKFYVQIHQGEENVHLSNVFYIPGTMLKCVHVISHLTFTTKVQRVSMTYPQPSNR